MGSVEKRTRDGKVTWLARWRDPDGRGRKRSFPRRIDADRYLTSIEHEKHSGAYVDPAAGRVTLAAWAEGPDGWLARQGHLKPKSAESQASLWRSRVRPKWGAVPLARITHAAAGRWLAEMTAGGLSASRARQSYHLLHGMLDDAVRDGRLARNPVEGVKLPALPEVEQRYLTHVQLQALAAACRRDGLVVLVLGYCGLRWGELAALRVRHWDGTRRRLRVVTSKNDDGRDVPVPRFLAERLDAHAEGRAPGARLFPAPRGGDLGVRNYRRDVFDPAAASVGLPGLVPHELRHTAASLAIAAGASPKAVQRMLGHRSAKVTLDRYGHLFDQELDDVAERLDAAAVPRACPELTERPPADEDEGPDSVAPVGD